ncbi:hypothetical protein FB567DRAFT_610726 [Paraphoma chrysanthemicola]|uniref:Heterokaryon incompatibility domain-containing protein n=1 Tax=Paraphoma chrysanthemicola TaxID=798071 RepID=A0A8K0VTU5_9PLEO|nr:hypothetical protein FB567DRAFT_610726 [Paraphoma chrysanthemicola]
MDRYFRFAGLAAQAILVGAFFGVSLSGYIYVQFAITRTLWKYGQEREWGYLEAFIKGSPFTVLSIYMDTTAMLLFPYHFRLAGLKSKRMRLVYPVLSLVASTVCWWRGYLPNFECRAIINMLLLRQEFLNERTRAADRDASSIPFADEAGLSTLRFDPRVVEKNRASEDLTLDYVARLLGGLHFARDYVYTPLTQARSIRILELEPSTHSDGPLVCSLSEYTLDDAPEFTALSYAWNADGGSTHVLCEMFRLKVTRNCARALHRIRDREGKERSLRLWVDAICIDQGQSEQASREKTQQIQIMGDVYQKATEVIAWVGEHENKSRYICDIITTIGETIDRSPNDADTWETVKDVAFRRARQWTMFTDSWREFFERSWFTRMWPIQEVVLPLPGRVSLLCGDTVLSWEHMRTTWQVLAEIGILIRSFKLDQAVALQFYLSDAVALKRNGPNAASLGARRPLVQSLSEVSLTSIMHATRSKGCSWPKDKFFALYGVLKELGIQHKVDVPRYSTLTEEEVYLQVLQSCFANDRSLDALRFSRSIEHYADHNDFWKARPEPCDSFANVVLASIADIVAAWQRGSRGPAPPWRVRLPTWIPDWTQISHTDADDRDIGLIRTHTTGMSKTSHGAAPSKARPQTRPKNIHKLPMMRRFIQRPQATTDKTHVNARLGCSLEIEGKVIGIVRSVGSVDSFALLWQSVGTSFGFYTWRRSWRAAWNDQKADKEPFFTSTSDAYVAAMIETCRNFLVHSIYAQTKLSLHMLYKVLDWKAAVKYANGAIWTFLIFPYLRSGVCALHPALSMCQPSASENTTSLTKYLIPVLIWALFYFIDHVRSAKNLLKHASAVLVFSVATLLWQLREPIYTTMYGQERWASSDGISNAVLFVMLIGQLLCLIAGSLEDDILLLAARSATLLVSPIQVVEALFYTPMARVTMIVCITTAIHAVRCIAGTWREIRGNDAFRRQDTFTSGLTFFSTETGLTGSTSAPVRLFDTVVILDWVSDPMVLRKTEIGYEVVGAAYVGVKSREQLEASVNGWERIRIHGVVSTKANFSVVDLPVPVYAHDLDMLCNTCQAPTTLPAFGERAEILRNIPNVKDELTSLAALHASANRDCSKCHVILEAVNKWHNTRGDLHHLQHPEQYVIGIAPLPTPGAKAGRTGGLGLAVAVTRKESWEHYGYLAWSRNDYFWEFDVKFELCTENDTTSTRYQIPKLNSVPSNSLCLADYARQAREWLEYCLSSHGDCCSEIVQELPTRVIDVGDHIHQARLLETSPGQRDAYCALSYCWGKSRAFTTTLATFRDRVKGFRIEELPKTISDAVQLASALDSADDWAYEASRMCAVYTNAAITFAAIDSPASDSGLFIAGANRRRIVLERTSGPIYARAHSHSALDDTRASQYDGTPARVLHTRGWCLQEIALSTRVLWMKSSEINWSCIRSTACECDPVPTNTLHRSNLFVLEFILSGVRYHEFLRSEPSQWLDLWTGLVLEFTSRRLTQASDRLPAIAGLATLIQRHLKTRYLFGLWETPDFLEQLLWSSLTHADESTWAQYTRDSRLQLTTDLAPSWSWASSSAHVSIPHGDFSDTMEEVTSSRKSESGGIKTRVWALRSIAVSMNTSNLFGTGTGTLELHSLLVPVMIHTHKSNGESVRSLTYVVQNHSETPDQAPLVLLRQFDWLQRCNIEDADRRYHFDAWRTDSRIDYEDESNWYGKRALYFIFANVSAPQQGKATLFNGLVLEQLNCNDQGIIAYRRLGYGEGAFMKLEDAPPNSQRAPDVIPLRSLDESFTRATWEYWKQLGTWSASDSSSLTTGSSDAVITSLTDTSSARATDYRRPASLPRVWLQNGFWARSAMTSHVR